MLPRIVLLTIISACAALAQVRPPEAPQSLPPAAAAKADAPQLRPAEPPADAYQRAMQPVEMVRRSAENITEAEMAAWSVAVTAAARDCVTRKIMGYSGEDLFHLARLCSLGQQHEIAAEAAAKYLADGNSASAESARGLIVRSNLAMGNLLHAERAARDLMRHHPYDGTVHALVQETITALAAKDTVESALQLESERHDALLAALRTPDGLKTHDGSYRFPPALLFRDAAATVFLYRALKRDQDADAFLAKLREALAAWAIPPSSLERAIIDSALRRGELLNNVAPAFTPGAVALPASAETATTRSGGRALHQPPPVLREIAYADKVTVLALYAPWSPQREKMFKLLGGLAEQYKSLGVQVFAASTPMIATGDRGAPFADVLSVLREPFGKTSVPVPVLAVSDGVAAQLAADDYPMFAVIDGHGTLRFLDVLSSFEYVDGGRMHRLLAGIVSRELKPEAAPKQVERVKVPAEKLQRRH